MRLLYIGLLSAFYVILQFFILQADIFPLVRMIAGVIYVLFMPGLLLLLNLPIRRLYPWEALIVSVGLSLVMVITSGFVLNQIFLAGRWSQPFAFVPLMIVLNLLQIPLLMRVYFLPSTVGLIREKGDFTISPIKLLALVIPVLTVFGVIRLNNGADNVLSIVVLLLVFALIGVLSVSGKIVSHATHVIVLWGISISLLYLYSLRSSYLVGWDIQTEYRVFAGTLERLMWEPRNILHAYNTTLAVTVLPTIISVISGSHPLMVFKVIYPAIYSLSVPLVYLILIRYFSKTHALLASVFFASQFQFFQQMPALARQEIAMFLFFLGLWVSFNDQMSLQLRSGVFLATNLVMIVSHYSTAYISVFIYSSVYAIRTVLSIVNRRFSVFSVPESVITFRSVLILFLVTFLWYGLFTNTNSALYSVIYKVTSNLSNLMSEEGKSEQAKLVLQNRPSVYTNTDLKNLEQQVIDHYRTTRSWIQFYPEDIVNRYPTVIKTAQLIPVANFQLFSTISKVIVTQQNTIKVAMILAIIGYSLLHILKKERRVHADFYFYSWVVLFLVMLSVVAPYLSASYNIERVYQQSLVFLGIFAVLGVSRIFGFIKLQYLGNLACAVTVMMYLFFYSGLLTQYLGGPASLNLSQFGDEYERFYITKADVESARWFEKQGLDKPVIFSDTYGWLRLQSNTRYDGGLMTEMYPGVLDLYSYVYATSAHIESQNARTKFNALSLVYNYPGRFLEDYKNVIYSNSRSYIYK